jgi:hypothetical protein
MQSEGNAPKNGERTVGFPSRQFSNTPVGLVKDFLVKHNVTTLEHSSCFPDLTPADFCLFRRVKSTLKGLHSCNATVVIKNATKQLKILSQNGSQECFQHLYSRWLKGMFAQGDYFEGNVA